MKQLLQRVRHLDRSLRELDLAPARRLTCEAIGKRIEAAVVASLSHRPGEEHAAPWEESGGLRRSISSEVTATAIVVGSTDPAAVFQEEGTRTVAPRPFLAPTSVGAAPGAVDEIGVVTAEGIREAVR